MAKKVNIVQDMAHEVPVDLLADEIVAISQGIRKLREGRLTDKALYLLIQHASPAPRKYGQKIGLAEIRAVFDGIERLETTFLKKRADKQKERTAEYDALARE